MQYPTLLASTLLAATGLVQAQDLVILPAPVDAWRVTVGHWEARAELTGDGVVAPAPKAQYASASRAGASAHVTSGRRDALTFDWRDLWQSMLRVESRAPLDLRPYVGGTLAFDLNVGELSQGGVTVKLGCGNGCERGVNLLDPARGWAGKGWQPVKLALSCFTRDGADFSQVTLPFSLEGTGSGRVSVANVRITRTAEPGLACPDYRTESVTPAMLDESWSVDWWLPRHKEKLEEKRKLLAAGARRQAYAAVTTQSFHTARSSCVRAGAVHSSRAIACRRRSTGSPA